MEEVKSRKKNAAKTTGQSGSGQEPHSRKLTAAGKKKKRKTALLNILLVLLIGVMLFSGYQIVKKLLKYKEADDAYSDLYNEVVGTTAPADSAVSGTGTAGDPADVPTTAAWTVPDVEPTLETDGEGNYVWIDEDGNVHLIPIETKMPTTTDAENETQEEELPLLSIDFAALKAKNSASIAWLQGLDGVINHPVVQGTDNSYYLSHLLDGTPNSSGTLFVDYRNRFLQDDITYIYGHHMINGGMFGWLEKYAAYSYYKTHPFMRLYTENATYELHIVAAIYTDSTEGLSFNFGNAESFSQAVMTYKYRSQYWTDVYPTYGDKLICLYTCAYQVDNGRFLLLLKAVRVE